MTVELSTEDQAKAEALVASGRYCSIADALHAGLEALSVEEIVFPWTPELQDAIDQGAAAMTKHGFANESDVDALFERYTPESA